METGQKTALRKCRVRLVADLSINDMFDSIEACLLFTPLMLENIKAKGSRPEQVRLFLDYLPRRGPDAFDKFLYCLRESGHDFVVSYIMQEYGACNTKNSGSCPSPGTIPINVHITQETQPPGGTPSSQNSQSPRNVLPPGKLTSPCDDQSPCDIVMGEINEGEVNLEEATMEISTPMSINGVQESQPYIPDPNIQTGPATSNVFDQTSPFPNKSSIANQSNEGTCSAPSVNGYSSDYKEEYKMESNPRGFLLIINNKEFSADLGVRTGTDIDRDRLKDLFLSLGFYVEVRQNLTATEIKLNLRLLSQYDKLHNVDCLAVAMLTHGNEDYLYGVDGNYIHVYDVFGSFTAENCQALHHKPKFFIINACRGDAEDKGSLASGSHNSKTFISKDINLGLTETVSTCRIPNMKDFLVAYSTIPGHVSWRHLNDGSFFIQGFVNVFRKYAKTMDVLKMLVKVNDEVSRNVDHQGVQIPAPQFMLTKTWYLNPIVRG
ncbi:luteolysis [Mactra antiquata]